MAEFFTSDLHFGHPLVAGLRGFGERPNIDLDAHDETVMTNWRKVIKSDDIVWVLGDLVGHLDKYRHALDLLSTLPGHKRLIAGNHDAVASLHRKAHRYQREYLDVFETVQDFAVINIPVRGAPAGEPGYRRAMLSHYPYAADDAAFTERANENPDGRHEHKYRDVQLPDFGRLLIHGHTHQTGQRLHYTPKGTPQIHVGLDAWDLSPVPMRRIMDLSETAA